MLGGGPSQSTDSYLLGENDKKAEPNAFYASISFTGGGNIALCRNWFSCLLCLGQPGPLGTLEPKQSNQRFLQN